MDQSLDEDLQADLLQEKAAEGEGLAGLADLLEEHEFQRTENRGRTRILEDRKSWKSTIVNSSIFLIYALPI